MWLQIALKRGIISVVVVLLWVCAVGAEKEWKAPPDADAKKNPLPADAKNIAAGKKLYVGACLECHGPTGDGKGATKKLRVSPGDLTNPTKMNTQSDGTLFWKLTEGKLPMPSYKRSMSEEERWQVVHYMRTLAKKESKPADAKTTQTR